MWCWGANESGQVTVPSMAEPPIPFIYYHVPVGADLGGRPAAAGGSHSCAIKGDGTLRCWGSDFLGQLGDGADLSMPPGYPVTVAGLDGVSQVTAGSRHTCALKGDATVWCWGYNADGQIGDGTLTTRDAPVQVKPLSGVLQVSAGGGHTCALVSDGSVWCWGRNASGQLGDGTMMGRNAPVQVGTKETATSIDAGYDHNCLVASGGAVWCWGANAYYQLGDGTKSARGSPVQVMKLTAGVASVSAGNALTCAVKKDGSLWCWGGAYVGDGTTSERPTPVVIEWP